jgi:hypothetical protein
MEKSVNRATRACGNFYLLFMLVIILTIFVSSLEVIRVHPVIGNSQSWLVIGMPVFVFFQKSI